METPTKTIPEIPVANAISAGNQFLAKFAGTSKPNKITWSTLVTTALSGLPPGYLISSTTPVPTAPASTPPPSAGWELAINSQGNTSVTASSSSSPLFNMYSYVPSGNACNSQSLYVQKDGVDVYNVLWENGYMSNGGSTGGYIANGTYGFSGPGTYTMFVIFHTPSGDITSNTVTATIT